MVNILQKNISDELYLYILYSGSLSSEQPDPLIVTIAFYHDLITQYNFPPLLSRSPSRPNPLKNKLTRSPSQPRHPHHP